LVVGPLPLDGRLGYSKGVYSVLDNLHRLVGRPVPQIVLLGLIELVYNRIADFVGLPASAKIVIELSDDVRVLCPIRNSDRDLAYPGRLYIIEGQFLGLERIGSGVYILVGDALDVVVGLDLHDQMTAAPQVEPEIDILAQGGFDLGPAYNV